MRDIPSANDVYSHANGGVYTIVTVANMDATRPGWHPTVVYEDAADRVWARPLTEFQQRFTRVAPKEENP